MDAIMNFFKPKNNAGGNTIPTTSNNTRKNNKQPANVNISNSPVFPEPTAYSGGRRRRHRNRKSKKSKKTSRRTRRR